MRHKSIILLIIAIGLWYISVPFVGENRNKYFPKVTPEQTQVLKNMKLTSSAFGSEEAIPKEFTCDGKGNHPPFAISGVPEAAASLAMIVDDPDAPMGTFTHWVIWNISPKTAGITDGEIPPKSQEGTNSGGSIGFYPPCPPAGSHRYFFTLFALDTTIGLDGKAKKAELENAMKGHIIEQTNLIGSYGR